MRQPTRNYPALFSGLITALFVSLLIAACGDYTDTPVSTRQNITTQATASSSPDLTENAPSSPTAQAGPAPQNLSTPQPGHLSEVQAVAYSPDGKILASGSTDGQIKLWQPATGQFLATISGHTKTVTGLAFSPDGKTLASSSSDKTIKLWNTITYKEIATLKGHTEGVRDVIFSPDGKSIVSSSDDETVKLWDFGTHQVKQTLNAFGPIAFSPNGKWLATGASSAKGKGLDLIKVWDALTGQEITNLKWADRFSLDKLAFRPDGGALAAATTDFQINGMGDGNVTVWDLSQGVSSPHQIYVQTKLIGLRDMAYSSDGKTIVVVGRAEPKGQDALYYYGVPLNAVTMTDIAVARGFIQLLDAGNGSILSTVQAHADSLLTVAFNPDGKTFATGNTDRSIEIWPVASPAKPALTIGQPTDANALTYSPDGKLLAAAGADNNVRLVETATDTLLATFKGHQDEVQTVAFSPDGKLLASGGKDGAVLLWDVAGRKLLTNWAAHSYWVNVVAFSPDGKTLASASSDTTIKLWDVTKPGSPALATLQAQKSGVDGLIFSSDGKTLISSTKNYPVGDEPIMMWDIASRQRIKVSFDQKSGVSKITLAPDNHTLAGITENYNNGSQNFLIINWDITTGKQTAVFKIPAPSNDFYSRYSKYSLQYLQNGQVLALAEPALGQLITWNVANQQVLFDAVKTNKAIFTYLEIVTFAPDGQSVAFSYTDASIKFTKLADLASPPPTPAPSPTVVPLTAAMPTPRPTLPSLGSFNLKERYRTTSAPGHRSAVSKVIFSPDGQTLFSGGSDKIIQWDIATKKELRSWETTYGAMALSADGKILAGGGSNDTIQVWNVATGQRIAQFQERDQYLEELAISPDGKILASSVGSYPDPPDTAIRLWRVADGKEIGGLSGHDKEVRYLTFSPDGQTLASATYEGQVKTWNVANNQLQRTLQDKPGAMVQLLSLTYSPDGKTLAATEYLGDIKLWDTSTGQLDQKHGHMYSSGLAFAPDGQTYAVGDEGEPNQNNFVRLYNRGGQALNQITSHVENTRTLAFSPDGKLLAFAGEDGTNREFDSDIHIWNVADNKEYAVLKGNGGGAGLLWLSPDGQSFVSQISAYTVKRFETATGKELASMNTPYLGASTMSVSPDGQTLATLGDDKVIRLYDLATGKVKNNIYGQQSGRVPMVFRPDGKALLTVDSGDKGQKILRLWDVNSPDSREMANWQIIKPDRGGWPFDIAYYSPNGQVIALVSTNYAQNKTTASITMLDASTGKVRVEIAGHPGHLNGLAFAPDGQTLATAGDDKTLRLWDVTTGLEKLNLKLPGAAQGLAFSPDGRTLVGIEGGQVQLWSVADKQVRPGPTVLDGYSLLEFSADAKFMFGSGYDGTTTVWDLT